jgi:hypothetical protein
MVSNFFFELERIVRKLRQIFFTSLCNSMRQPDRFTHKFLTRIPSIRSHKHFNVQRYPIHEICRFQFQNVEKNIQICVT